MVIVMMIVPLNTDFLQILFASWAAASFLHIGCFSCCRVRVRDREKRRRVSAASFLNFESWQIFSRGSYQTHTYKSQPN